MRVFNWFVKGLLSYVCVKGKAHTTKPTFVSTTGFEGVAFLEQENGHYAPPLAVVARGSVVERKFREGGATARLHGCRCSL